MESAFGTRNDRIATDLSIAGRLECTVSRYRSQPNEMEFSGERSESAGAPGMGAEEEVRDLPGP